MDHHEERLVLRSGLEEVDGEVGDHVGHIAARVPPLAGRRVEHRIRVRALPGKDLPPIEPGRIASQVPLPDHARVVAGLLEQLRHRHARAVEAVEHGHAVQMRVLAGQDGRPARRADRIRHEHALEEHALKGEVIDVRRLDLLLPETSEFAVPEVVGEDEDDVRLSLTSFAGVKGGCDAEHNQRDQG